MPPLKLFFTTLLALLLCLSMAQAQRYRVKDLKIFAPPKQKSKKILLLKDTASSREIILFQTNLRVNTDGTPLSYHPKHPDGDRLAINTVCNGMAIRRVGSRDNLCFNKATYGEALRAFEKFRDSKYQSQPPGYTITWKNVFAAVRENGKDVPCIFKSGDYKGYFGSLTRLKNEIRGDKGECEINDQVNPLKVPALVLAGGENAVKKFGAQVGDLLIAYNPRTRLFSSAIINDTGPPDNLGEGSVLLNMKLRGTTTFPTNRKESYRLSIENAEVLIAIIPGSNLFNVAKPYTAENVNQRLNAWSTQAGFESLEKLLDMMKSFQPRLN